MIVVEVEIISERVSGIGLDVRKISTLRDHEGGFWVEGTTVARRWLGTDNEFHAPASVATKTMEGGFRNP